MDEWLVVEWVAVGWSVERWQWLKGMSAGE